MGKTSATVKNRYNEKAYDRISLVVPKGQKEVIKAHAEAHGESLNRFIQRAIDETIKKEG
jgi:predicted HicB family RNase H-like nuclease